MVDGELQLYFSHVRPSCACSRQVRDDIAARVRVAVPKSHFFRSKVSDPERHNSPIGYAIRYTIRGWIHMVGYASPQAGTRGSRGASLDARGRSRYDAQCMAHVNDTSKSCQQSLPQRLRRRRCLVLQRHRVVVTAAFVCQRLEVHDHKARLVANHAGREPHAAKVGTQ